MNNAGQSRTGSEPGDRSDREGGMTDRKRRRVAERCGVVFVNLTGKKSGRGFFGYTIPRPKQTVLRIVLEFQRSQRRLDVGRT